MEAVTLGDNFGTYEDEKAFAYVYGIVPTENPGVFDPTGLLYGTVSQSCYIPVPFGKNTVAVPIKLDDDYNFKLLAIRYSALCLGAFSAGSLGYTPYYNHFPDNFSAMLDEKQNNQGILALNYLGVEVILSGLAGRILYGSTVTNQQSQSQDANVLQGGEYGFIVLRTPALLPRSSLVTFQFSNNSTANNTLYVAAAMYGMKVRV